jgi:hypothetical protein
MSWVRSLLGHVVIPMGGLIAWQSCSSCEAKIYCMDEGCKTSETLFHLMTDLCMPNVAKLIPMFKDNQGAVNWSSDCTVFKKLRHLNICIAVHDTQKAGIVHIWHVPGHSNVADIFTKENKSDAMFYKLAFQEVCPWDLLTNWINLGISRDSGGCWKESGNPSYRMSIMSYSGIGFVIVGSISLPQDLFCYHRISYGTLARITSVMVGDHFLYHHKSLFPLLITILVITLFGEQQVPIKKFSYAIPSTKPT